MSGTDTKAPVRHLTADELGERLGIDRWAVYALVKARKIPVLRIGRRQRFRLSDVEAWETAGGAPAQRPKAGRSRARKAGR